MKPSINLSIVLLAIVALISSCVPKQQVVDLQDQNRRLQEQIAKERDENAQLASYRFSLENQFRDKAKQYDDCKEDNKDNLETMTKKYDQLLTDYKKIEMSYKQLNVLLDQNKENDAKVIADLEERLRAALIVQQSKRRRRATS
jgi:uncharacterized membrane-anchored protein YhcB (DUF1043 family)